ncbi:hypothetical protein J4Q44_G00090620 [Coregonus suidteri]|uniref:Uncharacterized protein n=1 Tax=Coregonus suidteri TaxID=861788 RepID=A0AAN8QX45_9TELE
MTGHGPDICDNDLKRCGSTPAPHFMFIPWQTISLATPYSSLCLLCPMVPQLRTLWNSPSYLYKPTLPSPIFSMLLPSLVLLLI